MIHRRDAEAAENSGVPGTYEQEHKVVFSAGCAAHTFELSCFLCDLRGGPEFRKLDLTRMIHRRDAEAAEIQESQELTSKNT